jgi:outer membrane protein assembly factor BamB
VVAASVATAVIVALGAQPAYAAAAAPWREGDYGAARNSFNVNETLVNATSLARLAFARSRTAPPAPIGSFGCGSGVATQPVVVDHRMFVVLTSRLAAVDLTNGRTLWSVELDPQGTSTYPNLAVVGNRVILAAEDCTSASDPSGSITAYDAGSGAQVWRQFMDPGPLNMTVWQNHVLYTGYEAGGAGDLVSLAVGSGAVQWTYAPGFCDAMGRPVVVGGVVLTTGCDASFDPQMEGHSLTTGALLWVRPGVWDVQRGTSSDPTAGKDAYVRNETSGALTDVNPKTGVTRWVFTALGDALAVDGTHVYTDCDDNTLCAVVRGTGIIDWQVPAYGLAGHPVVVAGGVVYAGSAYGPVVRASNGAAVLDRFGEPLSIWSTPLNSLAIANGRVLATSGRIIDVYQVPGA